MAIEENNTLFKGVKTALLVLYLISLFGAFIMFGLTLLRVSNMSAGFAEDQDITPEQKDHLRDAGKIAMIMVIVIYAISLLFCLVAMYGVIKENQCTLVSMCVFSMLGTVIYFNLNHIIEAMVSALSTGLDFLFTYMVYKRQKE